MCELAAQMYSSRKRIGWYSRAKKQFNVPVRQTSRRNQEYAEWYMYIKCVFYQARI